MRLFSQKPAAPPPPIAKPAEAVLVISAALTEFKKDVVEASAKLIAAVESAKRLLEENANGK